MFCEFCYEHQAIRRCGGEWLGFWPDFVEFFGFWKGLAEIAVFLPLSDAILAVLGFLRSSLIELLASFVNKNV